MKKSSFISSVSLSLIIALSSTAAIAAEPAPADNTPQYNISVNGTDTGADALILVPLRSVGEALGFTVEWLPELPGANISDGSIEAELIIGNNVYSYHTTEESGAIGATGPFSLSSAPVMANDSIYVPAELFTVLTGNDPSVMTVTDDGISFNTKEEVQIPSPLTEHDTIESLEKAVSFEIKTPSLPEGYEITLMQSISGKTAEINYSDTASDICFRMALGTGDISGDYNAYPNEYTVSVDGVEIKCSGSELINKAVWENDIFTYSLCSDAGFSEETLSAAVASLM